MNYTDKGGHMRIRCSAWLTAVTLVFLTISAPGAAKGEDLIVEHNPTTGHFSTIQAAIDSAKNRLVTAPTTSFAIKVKADPIEYSGTFTPISNVPIIGESTAGTFLSNSGSGTIINLNGVSSVTIRNFTFRSALIGISATSSSAINITNNVFQLSTASTAILVQNSTSSTIINNTFFSNGTAISTTSDIIITNNIFSTNTTAILVQAALAQPTYNDFFANAANGIAPLDAHSIPNTLVADANPSFVDSANRDFHLQAGSPCVGTGNPQIHNPFGSTTSDMGAYGGPDSDTVLATGPATVTNLTSSPVALDTATMALKWDPTADSKVTEYRVYYGTSSRNYDLSGSSPLVVPLGTTTATLSNLPLTPPAVPKTPALTITPLNQALQLSWTPVPGATGYRIYHSTNSFGTSTLPSYIEVDGATVSSYQITGLNNGTHYFVAIAAVAQTEFFAAVTTVIDNAIVSAPGTANESAYSLETFQVVGDPQVSDISVPQENFPETLAPFPNLKGEGCFIATAAYGFYSAPQVQALRDFRDRFLLTNAPGRAFVAWYYHYGPRAAHYINLHPWLKAPVRVALFPLVVGALILNGSAPLAKIAIVMLAALLSAILFQRKMLLQSGGMR